MKRRVLVSVLPALGLLGACGAPEPPRRPHVLFLFTDDQRADTIHALGNPQIRTPNLDTLVESGFVFTNAYCMGSNVPAVCSPSRNMLLSGRAYFRWEGRFAPPEPANLADSMRQLGYETYHHGKKGNTAELIHKRFDHSRYVDDLADRTSGEPGKEIVDAAIEFLDRRTDPRPVFLYLAFASPHDPRVASERYRALYDPVKISLPPNYMPVHPIDNGEMTVRDEMLAPWPRSEEEIRRQLHDYYATITGLDFHIGRLLTHLKEKGLYDKTIIIFSSDQGLALGSHGLMGKQNLYDHSMKAPLIFSGPGVAKGRSDDLLYLMDIYPTLIDFLGGAPPQGLDGISHALVLTGQPVRTRKSLFLAYRDGQRAIRDERYKLIVYPHNNTRQLFDLENDPAEINNLAENPEYTPRIGAMMAAMGQWQQQLGDTIPLTVDKPADPRFRPPAGKALEELRAKWKM